MGLLRRCWPMVIGGSTAYKRQRTCMPSWTLRLQIILREEFHVAIRLHDLSPTELPALADMLDLIMADAFTRLCDPFAHVVPLLFRRQLSLRHFCSGKQCRAIFEASRALQPEG